MEAFNDFSRSYSVVHERGVLVLVNHAKMSKICIDFIPRSAQGEAALHSPAARPRRATRG